MTTPSFIVVAVAILSHASELFRVLFGDFATVLLSSNLPPTEFTQRLVRSPCLYVRQRGGIKLVGFSDVLSLYVLHLEHLMGAICAFSSFFLTYI